MLQSDQRHRLDQRMAEYATTMLCDYKAPPSTYIANPGFQRGQRDLFGTRDQSPRDLSRRHFRGQRAGPSSGFAGRMSMSAVLHNAFGKDSAQLYGLF